MQLILFSIALAKLMPRKRLRHMLCIIFFTCMCVFLFLIVLICMFFTYKCVAAFYVFVLCQLSCSIFWQVYASENHDGKARFLESYDKNGKNKNLSWVTSWTDTTTSVSEEVLKQNTNYKNRTEHFLACARC